MPTLQPASIKNVLCRKRLSPFKSSENAIYYHNKFIEDSARRAVETGQRSRSIRISAATLKTKLKNIEAWIVFH